MVLAKMSMSDTLNVGIEQEAQKQTGKILTVPITHPVRKKTCSFIGKRPKCMLIQSGYKAEM